MFTRSQHLEEVGLSRTDLVLHDVCTAATAQCDGCGVESHAQPEERGGRVESHAQPEESGGRVESHAQPEERGGRVESHAQLDESDGRVNESPFSDEEKPEGDFTSKREDVTEVCAAEVQPCSEETELEWEQFKSEFKNTLESSEQHIKEEETVLGTQVADDVRCLRQQLLIDAITALHSATPGEEKQAAVLSVTDQMEAEQIQEFPESWSTVDAHLRGSDAGNVPVSDTSAVSSYMSTSCDMLSPRQTGFLSLGRLETIHESKIDRMLELVESGTQPEALWEKSPDIDGGVQERDLPHLPLVWEMNAETGSEVLMKKLKKLSEKQSKQMVSTGTSTSTDATNTRQGILSSLGNKLKCFL